MKRSKLSETSMIKMLNEVESGLPLSEACRKYQIAQSTYYKIKSKYGGMKASDIKRLKRLEEENHKLKQMYADACLDKKILKEILEKKFPGLIGKSLLKK